jgi:hypothetical protein
MSRSVVAFSRAFLLVRAHLPFADRARCPDGIGRGDRTACGKTNRSERRSTGTCCRSGFWASLPRAVRFADAPVRSHRRPTNHSCRGLCLLQGCRPRPAFAGCACTRLGLVPALASPASGERVSRAPIRSWALRRPSRANRSIDELPPIDRSACRGCFRPGETRLPFSVLWG